MEKIMKFGLAILLAICLLDMPYGYFQFVRFLSLIIFVVFAYQSKQQGKEVEAVIYIALALLFQPFFKVALGRTLWNIIDILVAIGLVLTIFIQNKQNNSNF
ncbi:DUF6804 family protein [Riemerella columbina]|uniref:DUF6804 family protein n=1 Tax=Riemerella columbina TaxID=103810 RepID=UPI00037A6768|nr:DUF6804 family protein [Riemerella columbina]